MVGSSPRGRGKRKRDLNRARPGRIIPARAGKTWSRGSRQLRCTDHPRAGGENARPHGRGSAVPGSSPRGRGKLGVERRDRLAGRIIPARAGKTRSTHPLADARTDHPRAGGENSKLQAALNREVGSSPRGRGKRSAHEGLRSSRRIIPARAGKTSRDSSTALARWDHPRAGGENQLVMAWPFRGLRIIPARAGKTERKSLASRREPDHPRAGGENSLTS